LVYIYSHEISLIDNGFNEIKIISKVFFTDTNIKIDKENFKTLTSKVSAIAKYSETRDYPLNKSYYTIYSTWKLENFKKEKNDEKE
jgi:hypothetical protein